MGLARLLTYVLCTTKPRQVKKQNSFGVEHIDKAVQSPPPLGRDSSTYSSPNGSLLLKLPIDLIYELFERLTLPEKVLFSQTCRDLWHLLRCKSLSAYQKADALTRHGCLNALSNVLPDHRYCFNCRALKPVEPEDIPIRLSVISPQRCHKETVEDWQGFRHYYFIAFRHVQLAVKYARLGNVHQEYLSAILQKHSKEVGYFHSMKFGFTAKPIIIDGRFILTQTFTLKETNTPISSSLLLQSCLEFCPHMRTTFLLDMIPPTNPLLEVARSAFDVSGSVRTSSERLHSCDSCPTEFKATFGDRCVIFSVWQDLGTGLSPKDPYWTSHIWSTENNPLHCSKFDYKHGSIKALHDS